MEGEARTLYWFSNDRVKMEVPFFQRPYVWEEIDWEALVESINSSAAGNMPFMGSFILQKTDTANKYLVIDGQQRITTLSVLIRAFLDVCGNLVVDTKTDFQNMVYERTLIGLKPYFTPRLVPSLVDKDDFELVMGSSEDRENKIKESNGQIVKSYKYFVEMFKNLTAEQQTEIGTKIITQNKFFISIILDVEDDEQKIFDSVNSLGKDLNNSDLIKNFLFQRLKELASNNKIELDEVLKIHKESWLDVFFSIDKKEFWEKLRLVGRNKTNNLELFLKDFATIKRIYKPSVTGGIDGLAKSYKTYINSNFTTFAELKNFAKEIETYAKVYYSYTQNYENVATFKISDVLNTTLLILDKLETTTFNPFILKLVTEQPQDIDQQLFALQRFVLKRLLYKVSAKNYNNVCDSLIDSQKDNVVDYLNGYNENIDISEYPQGLKRITNKPATLILFLIELIRRKGEEDKYEAVLKYDYSLEHIMPQKWEENWSDVPSFTINDDPNISDKYVEVTDTEKILGNRKKYIYSIGNMLLLKVLLNQSLSNESFKVKVEGKGNINGMRKYVGSLNISKEIIEIYEKTKVWDERNIIERNIQIFNDLNKHYKF